MDEFCVRIAIVVYDLDDTGGWIRSPPRDLSFLSRACMDGDQDHHNRRTADLSSLCNCLDRTHRFLDDYEGPHARPMEADSRHGGRVCLWSVVTGAGFAGREGIVLPRACSGRMAMRLLIGQRNVVGEKERKKSDDVRKKLGGSSSVSPTRCPENLDWTDCRCWRSRWWRAPLRVRGCLDHLQGKASRALSEGTS